MAGPNDLPAKGAMSKEAIAIIASLETPAGYEVLVAIQQAALQDVAGMERVESHCAHYAHGFKDSAAKIPTFLQRAKADSDSVVNPPPPAPDDPITDHAEERFSETDQ